MLRDFEKDLKILEAQYLRRHLQVVESSSDTTITIDGRQFILMASNNYVGLATHPEVKKAASMAIEQWGVGAGASRLISGTLSPHQQLEETLARFKQVEATLIFGSGYTTNLGLIPALIDSNGLILADRFCHASLIEGCRLAKATLRIFHHNDMEHLEKLLKKWQTRSSPLIVTEGVFSMDGDTAPLPDLVSLSQTYGASLLIDDAHGTGVMGKDGRGTIEHFGLSPKNILQMGTLSKAIGAIGGFVGGTVSLKEYLINTSKAFIYTTALPPAMAAAASAAIHLIQNDPERRQRLWNNRNNLYSELKAIGFRMTATQSPILPILVKTPEKAVEMSKQLFQAGIYVPAIRPPTVPKGESRLRLTITSQHTQEQLENVISAFRNIGKEMRLI